MRNKSFRLLEGAKLKRISIRRTRFSAKKSFFFDSWLIKVNREATSLREASHFEGWHDKRGTVMAKSLINRLPPDARDVSELRESLARKKITDLLTGSLNFSLSRTGYRRTAAPPYIAPLSSSLSSSRRGARGYQGEPADRRRGQFREEGSPCRGHRGERSSEKDQY